LSATRERVTALITFAVLVFYAGTIGWRGVLLVLDGRWQSVLLGLGVIIIPLVALYAIWRLVVFARDGERMMQHLRSGAEPEPRDEPWRAHLVEAEECRVARDRQGEQAAYRRAVRAWRVSRS
jgi:hypothetical protein